MVRLGVEHRLLLGERLRSEWNALCCFFVPASGSSWFLFLSVCKPSLVCLATFQSVAIFCVLLEPLFASP